MNPSLIERTPIIVESQYSWEEAYETYNKYVRYAANWVMFQNNNKFSFIGVEDLIQEGDMILFECFKKYEKKHKLEFDRIFKSSLWRKLKKVCKEESTKSYLYVDLECASDLGYSQDIVQEIEYEFKLSQVLDLVKEDEILLRIFREFLEMSDETLEEAQKDISRKRFLKELGHKVSVPRQVTQKVLYIQRAWKINKRVMDEKIKEFKDIIRKVFLQNPFQTT